VEGKKVEKGGLVKVRDVDHWIKGVIDMELRKVKDIDHEGDRSRIVIEDVDTEMENNDALTVDTQKSKDWPTDSDLPV
jgi:hypothetical protein